LWRQRPDLVRVRGRRRLFEPVGEVLHAPRADVAADALQIVRLAGQGEEIAVPRACFEPLQPPLRGAQEPLQDEPQPRRRHQPQQPVDLGVVEVGPLGGGVGSGRRRGGLGPADEAGDHAEEVRRLERLGDEIVHAGGEAGGLVGTHGVGGQGDDRQVGGDAAEFADEPGGPQAVHHRHLHVHQDQVEAAAPRRLDRLGAVRHRLDAEADLLEDGAGQEGVDLVVFGQQHAAVAGRVGDRRRRGGRLGPVSRSAALGDKLGQAIDQRLLSDGLGQESLEPGLAGLVRRRRRADRRSQDQRRLPQRWIGPDVHRHRVAAHAGHHVVHEHHVVGCAARVGVHDGGERARAVGGLRHDRALGLELAREDAAIDLDVVDHQDLLALQGAARLRLDAGVGAGQRQFHPEHAAAARAVVHPDAPAHQLDELATDREAEAGAAELARDRAVGLLELLEHAPLRLARHADAGVLHFQPQGRPAAGRRGRPDLDGDIAGLGELDGVGEQVQQHLAQPRGIALEPLSGVVIEIAGELEPLLGGARRQQLDHVLHHRSQAEVDRLQLDLAGLQLRNVEDVVDDPQQAVGGDPHRLGVLALLRR
jgi:hypothetical protein